MLSISSILSSADTLGTGFLPVKEEEWWFAVGNKKYWKENDKDDLLISFTSIGGHVEDGEGIIDATLREVKEETGNNATISSADQTFIIEAEIIEENVFNFQIKSKELINIEDTPNPWIIYKVKTISGLLGVVVYQGEFDGQPYPQAEVPALICLPPGLLQQCPILLKSSLSNGAKLLEQDDKIPRNALIYPFGSATIIKELINSSSS
ncbi:MAG: hypothetical protein HeimC3_07060 [Candidatus Heimdallarchaeota archaeon LC_3]|nr:MAG: hypothetical protein HeimC3_07060 [Candidatus Heimdallarchaeota archaeon LC_3]